MPRVYVSVGSNIDPADNVRKALELLCRRVRITGLSTVYLTRAEGRREQPPYYNCVVEVETQTPPLEFKYSILRTIEEALGRKRTADKSASRTIDLDLILYDDLILETDSLILPDPQIGQRAFVTIPLSELSPGLRLPASGKSFSEIAADLPRAGMEPLIFYTENLRKELFRHERRKSRKPHQGASGRAG